MLRFSDLDVRFSIKTALSNVSFPGRLQKVTNNDQSVNN